MAKRRSTIPADLASSILFLSDHTCCVCNEKGRPVQVHHIDGDPTNHATQNLAALCLHDHDRTQVKGGFGRALGPLEVARYRDDWVRRVAARRERADELAALRMAGISPKIPSTEDVAEALLIPADEALVTYIENLPGVLAQAVHRSQPRWDSGVTAEMLQGTYDVIDVVRQVLVHLASWYPRAHFSGKPADEYFSGFVASRFEWYRAVLEPGGLGSGGTIVGPAAAAEVLEDLQRAVVDLVTALVGFTQGFALNSWRGQWEDAAK